MDPRTRVLVADFSLASGTTIFGAFGLGGSLAWSVAVAVLGFSLAVVGLYLAEQTPLLTLIAEHSPLSYLLAVGVTLAVGFALVLGWTVVASPPATLLFGLGLGLGVYRFVYGIVRPIPRRRLEQADYPADPRPD